MLDQNFEADQDQDDAAGPFCFGLVEDSEYSADFNADYGIIFWYFYYERKVSLC